MSCMNIKFLISFAHFIQSINQLIFILNLNYAFQKLKKKIKIEFSLKNLST